MNEMPNLQPDPLSADSGAQGEKPAVQAAQRAEGTLHPLPPDAMIVMPVRNVVLFPGIVIPLGVGRERSRAAIQEAVRLERPIGILLQNRPQAEQPGPNDLHWVAASPTVPPYPPPPAPSHPPLRTQLHPSPLLQLL